MVDGIEHPIVTDTRGNRWRVMADRRPLEPNMIGTFDFATGIVERCIATRVCDGRKVFAKDETVLADLIDRAPAPGAP